MLHQEIDAVLLQRDRVRIGLGHALDHVDVLDIQLEPARRALVRPHLARNNDGRLLRQALQRLKHRWRHALNVRHALHRARSVTKDRKQQLARIRASCKASP